MPVIPILILIAEAQPYSNLHPYTRIFILFDEPLTIG